MVNGNFLNAPIRAHSDKMVHNANHFYDSIVDYADIDFYTVDCDNNVLVVDFNKQPKSFYSSFILL